MWNREANSEDELGVIYRQHQHFPEPTVNLEPTSSRQTEATTRPTDDTTIVESGKEKKSTTTLQHQPARANSWATSDDKFDQQLMQKFLIGAHLVLSNIP